MKREEGMDWGGGGVMGVTLVVSLAALSSFDNCILVPDESNVIFINNSGISCAVSA